MRDTSGKHKYAATMEHGRGQGGGGTGKRDQHSLFFFGALPDTLPTPTFLIEYIFPTDMFSVMFLGDF